MAITKRMRYEVLRRDNYTCRYCGAAAPEVKITVDAVVPDALGGSHRDPSNLVAACGDCNNGKTSTNPDAPLVADVAADALRWAQAIQRAQAAMLADLDARAADRAQFEKWWDVWGYGQGANRAPVPRDPAWWTTVDQLRTAGLPLAILRDCIDLAMSRQKVKPEGKFRYMCGVAWHKVTELQDQARTIIGQAGDDTDELPFAVQLGRADLARELLSGRDDIDRLLAEARESWEAETDDEQAAAAAHIAWIEMSMTLTSLTSGVCDLLKLLPGDVPHNAAQAVRRELYDDFGEGFSTDDFACRAVSRMVQEYEARRGREYLASLPDEERGEWVQLADSLYASPGGHLSGAAADIFRAQCARTVREGGTRYNEICHGPGRSIRCCPMRAIYSLVLAAPDCCQDGKTDCEHLVCQEHLDQALAGGLILRDIPMVVASHEKITPRETVPF